MMEALRDTGLPADDPALQKALVFVSRCQNLKSEFNDQPWAGKVNDGGFIYTAANGGTSVAGKTDDGGLALVREHDLRRPQEHDLRRAHARTTRASRRRYDYITKHYTLDENPAWASGGCTTTTRPSPRRWPLGKPTFVDASGKVHDWRAGPDRRAGASGRGANGSWVNTADGFMEGDPNLVTAYGLLALSALKPKA